MATITVSLPSDGDTIDVANYNTPITTIVNDYNGNITNANISAAAGISGSKLADGSVTNAKLSTTAGNGPLKSKIITATYDLTTNSGDVAYTGVGFIPSSIIAFSNVSSGPRFNIGMSDSSKGMARLGQYGNNTLNTATTAICYISDGTNAQIGLLKSYDADGFTITWTKTASPTGTANLLFMCFR